MIILRDSLLPLFGLLFYWNLMILVFFLVKKYINIWLSLLLKSFYDRVFWAIGDFWGTKSHLILSLMDYWFFYFILLAFWVIFGGFSMTDFFITFYFDFLWQKVMGGFPVKIFRVCFFFLYKIAVNWIIKIETP